jgi:hypothetical protein
MSAEEIRSKIKAIKMNAEGMQQQQRKKKEEENA